MFACLSTLSCLACLLACLLACVLACLLARGLQPLIYYVIYAARGLQPCSNSQSMRHAHMSVAPELQITDVGWGRKAHLFCSPELENNGMIGSDGAGWGDIYVFRAVVCQTPTWCALSRAHGPFLWLDDHLFNFASFPPIPTGRVPAQALPTGPTTPWI